MYEDIQKIIDCMKRRIVSAFNPIKIILLGSYAQGGPGPDSGMDFFNVRSFAADGYSRFNSRTVEKKNIIGTVVREAWKEGKVIYERVA